MGEVGRAQREVVPKAAENPGELGDYRLLAKLGSGGQADVYLALSQGPMNLKRLVVVKRLRSAYEFHEEYITMFLDEARLAARLTHTNVVHTYEVGRAGKAYFIAMEYLDGQSLEQVMRAPDVGAHFTDRMWAAIVTDALAGLHYAHELCDYDGTPLGIVHRDVSPHNIFLSYNGDVKLVDFGIAKAVLNTVKTETGVLKGKITYMSPEQARGSETDRRSDLFAMGIILWEAVTGKRLFLGDPLQILNRLLNDTVPVPRTSAIKPSVHPVLDDIIARALARSPEDRFQTAEEMRKGLEAFILSTGAPVQASDLVSALTAMFGETHAHVKEQILAHIANVGSASDHKITSLTHSDPEVPELSAIIKGSPSGGPERDVQLQPAPAVEPSPPSRRSYVAIPVGLLLVGAVAAVAVRMRAHPSATPIAPSGASQPTAQPEATAALSVESDPPGAMVRWNGRPMGLTPMRVDLPVGAQTLVLSKAGYDDEPIVVEMIAGATSALSRSVKLRAQASPLASAPVTAPVARGLPTKGARGVASAVTAASAVPSATASPTTSAPRRAAPKDTW